MATGILVVGQSGSGKTTSLRNMNPKETLIFDCDKKGLPWKGWKKQYNNANKNYVRTSTIATIKSFLKRVDTGDLKHIKNVVVDTLNGIMVDSEIVAMGMKSYNPWVDLATDVYQLIDESNNMRDDLCVVYMGHMQVDRDDLGYMFSRLKTSGRKLDKICLESKFNTVLFAKAVEGRYIFETTANNSTAKSPMGLFDKEIPNDMDTVLKAIRGYES